MKSFEEVPKRVLELVQQMQRPLLRTGAIRLSRMQAVQIEKLAEQTKMTSPGSVQGNEGDTSDPFLRGLLGL